jgi:D-alanine transaminase
MSHVAYVDGRYVPHRLAAVHVEDRGYRFADGIYEVLAVVGGHLVDEDPHLHRLARSLSELRITAPMSDAALKIVMREASSEAFLTNTTIDLLPVVVIDGDPVGNGKPGPPNRRFREFYLAHAADGA